MTEKKSYQDRHAKPPTAVVFGAGITGLTAAHELIERGWEVTVVEPEVDPLNADACAVGGLAKTQWAVYQPGEHDGKAPSELRPMVPTVRLRRKDPKSTVEPPKASLSANDLSSALGDIFDVGSMIYLARTKSRLETIRPYIPRLCVQYKARTDSDDAHIAQYIVTFLESLGAKGVKIQADNALMSPGVWQIETDLSDATGPHGHSPHAAILPGEHGFRFFPAFYRNLFDTLKRIPVVAEGQNTNDAYRTVYDNLVPTEANWLALDDRKLRPNSKTANDGGVVRFPRRLRKSLRESFDALDDIYTELGYTIRDIELLKLRLFKYMTSCQRRRNEEYEAMSWSEFLGLSDLSEVARKDMETAPQLLAAMTASQSDARTQGNVATQLLLDPINADERVDSTLNAPTSIAWLGPWKSYLISQGVRFVPGKLTGFAAKGRSIEPVVVCDTGTTRVEASGYYVLAIPIQAWSQKQEQEQKNLLESWRDAKSALAKHCVRTERDHIDHLAEWIEDKCSPSRAAPSLLKGLSGIQFYLASDDLTRSGHTIYMDSPWRLSAISQASFWSRRREPFDGYRGIVSVDIGSFYDGSDPADCKDGKDETYGGACIAPFWQTPRKDVHYAVWRQIEPKLEQEQLPYRMYRIDEYIAYGSDDKPTENRAPFLINGIDEWDYRPGWHAPKQRRRHDAPLGEYEPDFEDAEDESSARYQVMPQYADEKSAEGAKRWVLAGTFMQTWTRATTMESANESAKHAVNTLLDHAEDSGLRAQYCRIWNPERYEHPDLRIWQELDEKLYEWCEDGKNADDRRSGEPLPHMVDILELDSLSDSLLDGDISSMVNKLGHRPAGGRRGS